MENNWNQSEAKPEVAKSGILSSLGKNKFVRAAALAAGLAAGVEVATRDYDQHEEVSPIGMVDSVKNESKYTEAQWQEMVANQKPHEFYDAVGVKDKMRPVPKGEYSNVEKQHHVTTLKNGSKIFHDAWLDFYQVKKGDTESGIRHKLQSSYDYLSTQKGKLESFNIKSKNLRVGMWLPIPIENEDRVLTDEQFIGYAYEALDDMRDHPIYGSYVKHILEHNTIEQVVAAFLAVAKQESGGKPLGQFELHRWEPHHKAFSFSLFHVLMKDSGLHARRRLNMSEGQTYHPRNACKLFLGFLIQKVLDAHQGEALTIKKLNNLLPIEQHPEEFAKFYNGSNWQRTNPNYVNNVKKYLAEADSALEKSLGN